MKALGAFAFLGLAFGFDDNEFIVRPVHPIIHHTNHTKVHEHVLHTPHVHHDKFLGNTQKIVNADDNDDELFQTNEEDEDFLLGLKFLSLVKKLQDDEMRTIFADDLEEEIQDNFLAKGPMPKVTVVGVYNPKPTPVKSNPQWVGWVDQAIGVAAKRP